jgi:protein-L-isoaspartate(D-aspartate) O-methyltransferase
MTKDIFSVSRKRMIEEHLLSRGIKDKNVIQVMYRIPRHLFVDEALHSQAYGDTALGIGFGQTISQPYSVAKMTEALMLKGDEKILEIGTGCGYQTSVLSVLSKEVYTIERIKGLALKARDNLKKLNLKNITMRVGDGTKGWMDKAPFDGILIAAGSPQIPMPLIDQMKVGGRLIIPLGDDDDQKLYRITKTTGKPKLENLGPCKFVKLVGAHGWRNQRKVGEGVNKRSLV